MPEVVGAFSRTELGYERANCSVETRNGPLSGFAQESLEFAVGHLDGVEVGRVFGQVAECRSRFLDCLTDTRHFVGRKVVYHDDVVALERGSQALLDIGQEHLSGHSPRDHHGRGHFVVTQRGHKGDRLPFSKRNAADQSDAARGPPLNRTMLGLTAVSSINTSRQGSSIPCSRIQRRRARTTSARSRSAACRLFLRVMSCRPKNRESALRLVRMRRLRSSATVSTNVKSGCSAIIANTRAACFSSGETLPPRGFGAALPLSCQRCSHLTAELTLTSKRSAASYRDAPNSTASITRSRRSAE